MVVVIAAFLGHNSNLTHSGVETACARTTTSKSCHNGNLADNGIETGIDPSEALGRVASPQ